MRVFGWVMSTFALIVLFVTGWSSVASLLTAENDFAVLAGVSVVAVAIGLGAAIGVRSLVKAGLIVLALSATGCTRVEPGWEGIKVDMLASERGKAYPIVTGRVWFNPYSEDIYEFPIFTQRVIWQANGEYGDESITFRSKEGYAFNADIAFAAGFKAGTAPKVFLKWRRSANDIMHGPFRDVVRETFVEVGSQMAGLQILGAGMPELNSRVTNLVKERLGEFSVVDYVNIVGKPRVDQQVEASINAVIAATQQANVAQENVRKVQAEAEQAKARADGEAQSIERVASAKANALRIESEALRQFGSQVIEMRAIEKWDGKMPQIVGSNAAMPFIQVPSAK